MAFSVTQAFNHSAECAAAGDYPSLRLFTVAQNFDWSKYHKGEPRDFNQSGVRQLWSVSSPDSVCAGGNFASNFDYFSAVAFFFCRDLQTKLGIPVGCVATSVPGTNIELWSSTRAMAQCADRNGKPSRNTTGALWAAMVAPLTRMSVKGFIWYQARTTCSCTVPRPPACTRPQSAAPAGLTACAFDRAPCHAGRGQCR